MKILVPVKRVVDYSIRIHVKPDGSGVDTANVKMSMNPFDEIALEEAIRLKEKGIATEIIAVSLGEEKCQETLRAALAMGADRAVHINTTRTLEPLAVAKLLKAVALEEKPDLILMGKQAIDDDINQTGQMLAALLQLPQGTFASKLEIKDGTAIVTRETDNGLITLSLKLPAVIPTDLRLNTPRYTSLPNIMKARSKPLTVKNPEEYNIDLEPRQRIITVEEPAKRTGGKKVATVKELVEALKKEGVL